VAFRGEEVSGSVSRSCCMYMCKSEHEYIYTYMEIYMYIHFDVYIYNSKYVCVYIHFNIGI